MQKELEMIEKFEENSKFLTKHFDDIQGKHQEEFVAIYRGKIVDANKDLDELIGTLEGKKIDVGFVLIEFLPKKGITILY